MNSDSLRPEVTEYTISPFPQDQINGRHWKIQIQRRTDGTWVIHNVGYWLQPDRTWYPDRGSAVRFVDAGDAADLARQVLPDVVVNGRTYAEMCERWGTP